MNTALHASIEHWKRLKKCTTPTQFELEGFLAPSCPLCKSNVHCSSCPIMKYTGKRECHGTPYYYATSAIRYFMVSSTKRELQRAHKYIQDEIDFLIQLSKEVEL